MTRHHCVRAVARGICLASLLVAPTLLAADEKQPPGKDPFGLTKVWSIQLALSAKEYEAMQPAVPQFGGPGSPPQPPVKAKKAARDGERNLFGTEFPWAEGDVTIDGKALKKVGVRYAGDITYFSSAQGLKRPLKIQFDKFNDQQVNGLSSVHLHSMPLDASKAREAVAFSIFRAASVPAPRTAFVELTLTVPGTHDKAYLGLFTAVENVDPRFLADRFGADQGLLMKPFRNRGVDFLGDDWERYKGQYQPQSEATGEQVKRVIEFARFVNQANDADFKKQIETYIDVDAFLRFLAANALVSNLESFF